MPAKRWFISLWRPENRACVVDPGQSNPWWSVDVGGEFEISHITIYNRYDAGETRLSCIVACTPCSSKSEFSYTQLLLLILTNFGHCVWLSFVRTSPQARSICWSVCTTSTSTSAATATIPTRRPTSSCVGISPEQLASSRRSTVMRVSSEGTYVCNSKPQPPFATNLGRTLYTGRYTQWDTQYAGRQAMKWVLYAGLLAVKRTHCDREQKRCTGTLVTSQPPFRLLYSSYVFSVACLWGPLLCSQAEIWWHPKSNNYLVFIHAYR